MSGLGMTALRCFAATAPGLEPYAARELVDLGVPRAALTVEPGGVSWTGDARSVYRANLWLRTASRVLVRVAEFKVTAFWELERRARPLPWEIWFPPNAEVDVRATCKKSRLYHSDAVAQRIVDAVSRRVPGVRAVQSVGGDEEEETEATAAQLVVARLARDVLTVSVDASGALLHRRGYRQAVARAPLRETTAAAMLIASRWTAETPLLDPFCGSGTIPIEAALMARGIAPGLQRAHEGRFGFTRWPSFDAAVWRALIAESVDAVRPGTPCIAGYDRDAGAVASSLSNAQRAGVEDVVSFERRPISELEPPASGPGWLVSNPPYGVRVGVGEGGAVRDLWARLGQVAKARLEGWEVALLSPDPALERQTALSLTERFRTQNGGIPVRFVVGRVS